MARINRALISVYNKEGITEFARVLDELEVEIVSTGGTARALKDAGVKTVNISDITGYPEMLDGRVKTLHPAVHGGILARRCEERHIKEMEKHNIQPVDLVVVNLYPFEDTISNPDASLEEAVEQIDIGGVALIRSAAKNFKDVAVVINPSKYELIMEELKRNKAQLTKQLRLRLSVEAFKYTSLYDRAIHRYLAGLTRPSSVYFPNELTLNYAKVMDLRYGENPHQRAAFYREVLDKGAVSGEPRVQLAKQAHGKEMSFNNILDLDGALGLIKEFYAPAAVIVKHSNPCGAALGETAADAYKKALSTDPVSSFGSIVVLNEEVDEYLAEEINKMFIEVLAAPSYAHSAMNTLKHKKNIRILSIPELDIWRRQEDGRRWRRGMDVRKVVGGVLVQDRDITGEPEYKVVTKRAPDEKEWEGLRFAWKVVKYVKSNAIVIAKGTETAGIGAGQMSRVDSVKIAVMKVNKDIKGSVLASDAFFPFKDGVEEAASAGVTAVIQPGGSIRDKEVIEAADKNNMAMVFTGVRHFRH